MKQKLIAQVTPYMMDGYLILSLDGKWLEIFGKIPTFSAILDKDGKLKLVGPVVSKKENCVTIVEDEAQEIGGIEE